MVTARPKRSCGCNSVQDLGQLQGAAQLERMQAAVELLLRGLGEDPQREGLRDTPRRVAKAWLDIASGYSQECTRAFGKALFHEPIVSSGAGGMVVVRDITFAAMSEATLLPFHGRAHIAYAPRDGVILGLSKLARVTKCLASKLQQQEAFTHSLMEAVQAEVGPAGVAVVVQANHLGPPGQPAAHVTSAVSGCFAESGSGQLVEFLTLLRLSGIAAAGQLLGRGAGPAAAAAPQLQHFAVAAEASSGHRCAVAGEPPGAPVGRAEMAAAVQELLEGVGEAPGRPGLKGSPERYVAWLYAATAGYHMSLPPPPGCTCGPRPAAAEAGGTAAATGTLAEREGSPEGPATPADQSPDASCAASDTSAEELALEQAAAVAVVEQQQQQQQQRVQPGAAAAAGAAPPAAAAAAAAAEGRICTFAARFTSQCEHHLLPFYGSLRLAYTLPAGAAAAAGPAQAAAEQQLQHIVEMYSRRLQVQERLSHQVADAALGALGAASVLVVVDSAHMCMVARGVEKHASTTLTTAARGRWAADVAARTAAMEALLAP